MTAFAALNEHRISTGTIVIPWVGLWSADVMLDSTATLSGLVTLTLGTLSLVGSIFRQADWAGALRLRLIGGHGGWLKTLPPSGYNLITGVQLSTVLGDAARDVGETVKLASDRSLGNFYTREEAPAERLLNRLSSTWYVRPDGSTYVGDRASGEIVSQFDVLSYDGGRGSALVGVTDAYADWTPGRTFRSAQITTPFQIGAVTMKIGKEQTRVEVMHR